GGENRAGTKLKRLTGHLEDFGAENIRRHQVRRKLDAAKLRANKSREGLGQKRLADSRNTFKQQVASTVNGREQVIHQAGLAGEAPLQPRPQLARLFANLLQFHVAALSE